jgi:hypothetical protein
MQSTGQPYETKPSMAAALKNYIRTLSFLLLFGLSVLCVAVCCCGFVLTTGLLVTRWVASGQVSHTRAVYFDYSRSRVEGKAVFSQNKLGDGVDAVEQSTTPGPKCEVVILIRKHADNQVEAWRGIQSTGW